MLLLRGHDGPVRALAYAPDGGSLASGGDDGTVRLWDVVEGRERMIDRSRRTRVRALAFRPDGGLLASGGGDLLIQFHPIAPGTKWVMPPTIPGFPTPVNALAIGSGGKLIVATGGRRHADGPGYPQMLETPGGEVIVWKARWKRRAARIRVGDRGVWSLAVHPAGGPIALGTAMLRTFLWDPTAARRGATIGYQAGRPAYLSELQRDGPYSVREPGLTMLDEGFGSRTLSYSPDGRFLASSRFWTMQIWDVEHHRLHATGLGHRRPILAVAFAPDGGSIASAGLDGTVRIWDPAGGLEIGRYDGEVGRLYSLAYSPDGMTLAAGGDGGIVVWDAPGLL